MEIQHNQIYNEDCLQFMKQLPDNYFDLIITDPPYGIKSGTTKNHGGRGYNYDYEWDNQIPNKDVFKEILRVSKNQVIFGGNYFIDFLHSTNCFLIWDKKQRFDGAEAELIWTSFKSPTKVFKYSRIEFANQEKKEHPTQKPIKISHWILSLFAKKGDLIFDPFAGSGSFLVACKQKGFKFVGCEINKDYVAIANKRLAQQSVADFTLPNGNPNGEFNMGLKVPTSSPPKSPSATSPNPNIKSLNSQNETKKTKKNKE